MILKLENPTRESLLWKEDDALAAQCGEIEVPEGFAAIVESDGTVTELRSGKYRVRGAFAKGLDGRNLNGAKKVSVFGVNTAVFTGLWGCSVKLYDNPILGREELGCNGTFSCRIISAKNFRREFPDRDYVNKTQAAEKLAGIVRECVAKELSECIGAGTRSRDRIEKLFPEIAGNVLERKELNEFTSRLGVFAENISLSGFVGDDKKRLGEILGD